MNTESISAPAGEPLQARRNAGSATRTLAAGMFAVAWMAISLPLLAQQAPEYNEDLYQTPFTDGDVIQGEALLNSAFDGASHELYRFCAADWAEVTIEVHRTTSEMDPALVVCQEIYTQAPPGYPDCTPGVWGTFSDDDAGVPHDVGGNFGDPTVTFFAQPSPTGATPNEFTLRVMDVGGSGDGPTAPFEIHASGVSACEAAVTTVGIDFKPGNADNSVNLCAMGTEPVAILGSAELDIYNVDVASLRLADAAVREAGNSGRQLCSPEDANLDGFYDLVCHFETSELVLDDQADTVELVGALIDGTAIAGEDAVTVVPGACDPAPGQSGKSKR